MYGYVPVAGEHDDLEVARRLDEHGLHASEARLAGEHDRVVEHHAEAALHRAVDVPDRGRLDHVERAEQEERGELRRERRRHQEQHRPERDHLVPDHAAVVGHAEVAAGAPAGPDPDRERRGDHRPPAGVGQERIEDREDHPGPQRAERAGRGRGEAAAEAERDPARQARLHELEARVAPDAPRHRLRAHALRGLRAHALRGRPPRAIGRLRRSGRRIVHSGSWCGRRPRRGGCRAWRRRGRSATV